MLSTMESIIREANHRYILQFQVQVLSVPTKIEELQPNTRSANLTVKVLSISEPREIQTIQGPRVLREALVGDETATILMTLWGKQGEQFEEGDVLKLENAYVRLVRGRMRLNVGRHGRITKLSATDIDVNTSINMSEREYLQRRRRPARRRFR